MKLFSAIALILFLSNFALAQNTLEPSEPLTLQEVDSIFTDSVKNKLQIEYPIFRVYEYADKIGKHFIVMTHHEYPCQKSEECIDSIKAYCYGYTRGRYNLEWKLRDFILTEGYKTSEEYSIRFSTKYFELGDFDGDGIIDPIMVIASGGTYALGDGRVKILVYHNGQKRAIRHQNGMLDYERNTQVDREFYTLPKGIQDRVKTIIKSLVENGPSIFPSGWEDAMKNKELRFDEN